jgi:hypothetical protein
LGQQFDSFFHLDYGKTGEKDMQKGRGFLRDHEAEGRPL